VNIIIYFSTEISLRDIIGKLICIIQNCSFVIAIIVIAHGPLDSAIHYRTILLLGIYASAIMLQTLLNADNSNSKLSNTE